MRANWGWQENSGRSGRKFNEILFARPLGKKVGIAPLEESAGSINDDFHAAPMSEIEEFANPAGFNGVNFVAP